MKWIIALAMGLVVFADHCVGQQIDFESTHPREWTDSSGQSGMTATLVRWDQKSDKVTLRTSDETTLEVSLKDLFIFDRRYIERQTAKVRRAAKRSNKRNQAIVERLADKKKPEEDFYRLNTAEPSAIREFGSDVWRQYEIDWHQQTQTMQAAAQGGEGIDDDKPIVWFRVLGDLAGYM